MWPNGRGDSVSSLRFLVLCCVWDDVCDGLIISKLFNKLYYLFNDETTVYDCRSVTHIG